jgi:hypothetical protein
MCGRYEASWEGDEPHPLIALHDVTEELDNMARAVLRFWMNLRKGWLPLLSQRTADN